MMEYAMIAVGLSLVFLSLPVSKWMREQHKRMGLRVEKGLGFYVFLFVGVGAMFIVWGVQSLASK